jgi:membrane associated rhomboid family serine protease
MVSGIKCEMGICSALQEILLNSGRVPQYLQKWLQWRTTWQKFEFKFLREWGARWAPALERGGDSGNGAWYLWVTPIYVHQNLSHVISNLLLFVAMSVHLELNYGWWRMLLVWVISGTCFSLFS